MIEQKKKSSPSQLRDLCLQKVLNEVLSPSSSGQDLILQCIPIDLSQEVFDYCVGQTVAEEINDVFKLFLKSPTKTPLQRLLLQNSRRADVELIQEIVRTNLQTLTHIDVRGCRTLPKKFWCLLNQAPNLTSLKTTKLLLPLRCPKLESLVVDWKPNKVLQKVQSRVQNVYYDKLLENVLPNLRCLDLSWCPWIKRLKSLGLAKKLEVLALRNCDVSCLLDDIAQLFELRALDISVGLEAEAAQDFNGEYTSPESMLKTIVTSLVKLESLDISGTNLATPSKGSTIPAFKSRSKEPFKFLGLYSNSSESCQLKNMPSKCVASNNDYKSVMETIKRNCDMPKTLHNQLYKLRAMGETSTDANEVLLILLKILKTIRLNEYFRYWALKCTNSFLETLENPHAVVAPEIRRELFLVLNRLIHSHMELEKVPEPVLCYTFKIFLKLLPPARGSFDDGTRREIMRLGKFLMQQNSMAFVYLKTEALLFRLLYRISLEPEVCVYLSHNKAVSNCFDFFKTLQIYLGFALTIRQTTEIVPLVWKSIHNFMKASPIANQDFVKNCGLSWMFSHTSWFVADHAIKTDLYHEFMGILTQLEQHVGENNGLNYNDIKQQNICGYANELMTKLKTLINEAIANE